MLLVWQHTVASLCLILLARLSSADLRLPHYAWLLWMCLGCPPLFMTALLSACCIPCSLSVGKACLCHQRW
ncbi:hypothetical protein V8C86DRAFT_2865100 [Haematococcus lacustris]